MCSAWYVVCGRKGGNWEYKVFSSIPSSYDVLGAMLMLLLCFLIGLQPFWSAEKCNLHDTTMLYILTLITSMSPCCYCTY